MANLILNADFELGSANWIRNDNSLVIISFNDLKGSIVARLLPGGILSQSLSLSPNTTYSLNFKAYPFFPGGPIQVNVGGSLKEINILQTVYDPAEFKNYTETFTTPETVLNGITFTNPTSNTIYVMIDDLLMETTVPEPETTTSKPTSYGFVVVGGVIVVAALLYAALKRKK